MKVTSGCRFNWQSSTSCIEAKSDVTNFREPQKYVRTPRKFESNWLGWRPWTVFMTDRNGLTLPWLVLFVWLIHWQRIDSFVGLLWYKRRRSGMREGSHPMYCIALHWWHAQIGELGWPRSHSRGNPLNFSTPTLLQESRSKVRIRIHFPFDLHNNQKESKEAYRFQYKHSWLCIRMSFNERGELRILHRHGIISSGIVMELEQRICCSTWIWKMLELAGKTLTG